jgi:WD40 repeat protein
MQILKGHGYNKSVYTVAFSPDGTSLASCGRDGKVRLWDLGTGQEVRSLDCNRNTHALCFSPDGRRLAWAAYDQAHILDLGGEQGRVAFSILDEYAYPRLEHLVFAPDGRWLFGVVGRSWHQVTTVDILDSQAPPTEDTWTRWPGSEHCTALALSPDGRFLATGHNIEREGGPSRRFTHPVVLWDVKTRQERARLEGPSMEVTTLAFSPTGAHLAATSGTALWVWDAGTREEAARIKIDVLHFKSVAFSPDGRWLATARNDATVRFYDTRTWSEGPAFDWKIGPVISLAFARDGMRAACGSGKGKVVVWDVDV